MGFNWAFEGLNSCSRPHERNFNFRAHKLIYTAQTFVQVREILQAVGHNITDQSNWKYKRPRNRNKRFNCKINPHKMFYFIWNLIQIFRPIVVDMEINAKALTC